MPDTTPSIVGRMVTPWHVEQAALTTVAHWLDFTLAELERQVGLKEQTLARPPSEASYFGGVDMDSFEQDDLPSVVVIANPTGIPERNPGVGYGQLYEVQIGVTWIDQDEDTVRRLAGFYATAAATAIAQHGALNGLSAATVMTGAPDVRFPDADKRTLAQGVCEFHVFVDSILNDQGGVNELPTPPDSAPPDYPDVLEADTEFTAVPATQPIE